LWLDQERARTECQGYRSGWLCREHMAKNLGCYAQVTRGTCHSCCQSIIAGIERDNQLIGDNCEGKGWPRPKSPSCEF
jgi:hypothetical protein